MLAIISMKKKLYTLMAIICWILKASELFIISASSNSHVHGNYLGNLIELGQNKDAAALKWSQMVLRDAAVCCPQMSSNRPKKSPPIRSYVTLALFLHWTLDPDFWAC